MKDKIHFPSAKMTVWKCIFPLNLFASSYVQIALLIREPGHLGLILIEFCHCYKFCKHFNFPYMPVSILKMGQYFKFTFLICLWVKEEGMVSLFNNGLGDWSILLFCQVSNLKRILSSITLSVMTQSWLFFIRSVVQHFILIVKGMTQFFFILSITEYFFLYGTRSCRVV